MSKQRKPQTLHGLGALSNVQITEEGVKVKKGNPAPTAGSTVHLPNLSWAYWVDYFRFNKNKNERKGIKEKRNGDEIKIEGLPKMDGKNRVFFNANHNDYRREVKEIQRAGKYHFTLTTTYPGLLAGSGYQHEMSAGSELKLGCFFDHTTGLPVIPGSSVKGVLRSAFEPKRATFLSWLAESSNDENLKSIATELREEERVKKLRNHIFGYDSKDKEGRKAENNIPIYDRDIFYDAVIVGSEHRFLSNSGKNGKGQFLGTDFITPHINREKRELSPFTNPIPLQFIKVLPEVTFEFRFDLKNTTIGEFTLTASQKEKLFRAILLLLGAGAKTNVGYGQFK